MIISVQRFQTTDGKLHQSKPIAEKHEYDCIANKLYNSMLPYAKKDNTAVSSSDLYCLVSEMLGPKYESANRFIDDLAEFGDTIQ